MRKTFSGLWSRGGALTAVCLSAVAALAGPVVAPWPFAPGADTSCAAASGFGGYFAVGDSYADRVEIRDIRQALLRTITRAEMQSLLPWMSLDGGPDGPSGLAFTATGKQLFILVHDDTLPPDGQGSDGVLRYDLASGSLTLFARLDLFDRGDQWPRLAAVHHKAVLYVGTGAGTIKAYLANSAITAGSLLATWNIPGGGVVHGLTVDRDSGMMFAATATGVYRTQLTNSFGTAPAWAQVCSGSDIRAVAWGDPYGSNLSRGLYILSGSGAGAKIDFVAYAGAYWPVPVTPGAYVAPGGDSWNDLCASGDGRMIVAQAHAPAVMSDDSEVALGFDAWMHDELDQTIGFGRGLISPDGEPAGWVIDADVPPGMSRFHPATPDGACWTILLLLESDAINHDPAAQGDVRSILKRYAGLMPDGIGASRSTDGIFRHWIDPLTGQTKSGWDPEFAIMSTMKMVLGASRAMSYYPDDPEIARAASRIIFRTRNWDAYIRASDRALYLTANAGGGPNLASPSTPFHEGVLFVEQASVYGGAGSQGAYSYWLDRPSLPSASYLPGFPITSTANGLFEASFISLYSALVQPAYRASADWQAQVRNVRWSNAAWTDDFGPRYSTVFSAGTTRSDWGGYNADSLGNHPGNITTFTSLMGLCALGDVNPAVGAYHAYRKGARETFKSGASILYRRSDVDRSYTPDAAGLPDVALGALALGEIIQPGVLDAVLSRPYEPVEMCPADRDGDGIVGIDDEYTHEKSPTDLNGDSVIDVNDALGMRRWLRRHERTNMLGRP